jgi:DtxR family transcriptional regulator, Mn-dependent transcriptional regulator
MKISDRAQEILESLWGHEEGEANEPVTLGVAKGEPEIEELIKLALVKVHNDKIKLTDKGRSEGEKVVRRHRLAERLFTDVLDFKDELVHPVSCQFEHLLHENMEDNICILLGHPTTCPHGRRIPPGECCRKSEKHAGKVVSPLSSLAAKQKGKVAYIHTKDQKKLQKLMAMSVLPGLSIVLLQTFPSYVFQIGQSQFAIDKELAESIYVRLEK